MTTYNGHPNWNAWNVSLWISNDEGLYRFALDCLEKRSIDCAARLFIAGVGADKTPDGARYTLRSVRHALAALREE